MNFTDDEEEEDEEEEEEDRGGSGGEGAGRGPVRPPPPPPPPFRSCNIIFIVAQYLHFDTGKKIVFQTLGFNLSTMGSVPSNVFKDFEYV